MMRFVLKYTWWMGFHGDHNDITKLFPTLDAMELEVEAMQDCATNEYFASNIKMYEIINGQMVRL